MLFRSLIAAGIGIMNIMLVSVTERTREIGIRRAIGAKKRDIMTQFIIEAVVLCEIGGILGIVLGMAGANALAIYLLKLPPAFPVDWALIGLLICSLIGVVFGSYPAYKAAHLDPIESLESTSKSSSSPGATFRMARRMPRACSIESAMVAGSGAWTKMPISRRRP